MLSLNHTMLDNLGPVTVCAIAHLTMSPDVYSWLEMYGMLGTTKVDGAGWTNNGNTT